MTVKVSVTDHEYADQRLVEELLEVARKENEHTAFEGDALTIAVDSHLNGPALDVAWKEQSKEAAHRPKVPKNILDAVHRAGYRPTAFSDKKADMEMCEGQAHRVFLREDE